MTSAKWRRALLPGDPGLELPAAYYEELYARDLLNQSGTWWPWRKQHGKHLWYATTLLAEPPVFDVGCGAGHLAAMYSDYGMQVFYAGGIDYSKSAIELAKHHAPWATFAAVDASRHRELLGRSHYQTAVLLEVLEHVYHDLDLLRLIPVGRKVVFSVPSFQTDGHCRWFATTKQVRNRYSPLVAIDRIVVEEGIQSDNLWFVARGVRR